MATVSVIMNCYNSGKYLKTAIDSVYEQTYKDWEIIFWDNASTDNSAQIAKSYDNKLKYFISEETVSVGRARNWAMAKARGKYIAFLDCDDLWLPTKLEKQMPLFENNIRVGLVYSDSIFFNGTGRKFQLYKKEAPFKGKIFNKLLEKYFLSMETVIIRKTALDSLSEWFDERFNTNEEADLFIRIAYNWEADYVPEPLAMWRVHAASLTVTKKHLFPLEMEMQLEKYASLYADFNEIYSNEVNSIKCKIQYQLALLDWEKGDNHNARKRLKPYLGAHKKFIIPYLMSVLPYRFYKYILNLRYLQV